MMNGCDHQPIRDWRAQLPPQVKATSASAQDDLDGPSAARLDPSHHGDLRTTRSRRPRQGDEKPGAVGKIAERESIAGARAGTDKAVKLGRCWRRACANYVDWNRRGRRRPVKGGDAPLAPRGLRHQDHCRSRAGIAYRAGTHGQDTVNAVRPRCCRPGKVRSSEGFRDWRRRHDDQGWRTGRLASGKAGAREQKDQKSFHGLIRLWRNRGLGNRQDDVRNVAWRRRSERR